MLDKTDETLSNMMLQDHEWRTKFIIMICKYYVSLCKIPVELLEQTLAAEDAFDPALKGLPAIEGRDMGLKYLRLIIELKKAGQLKSI